MLLGAAGFAPPCRHGGGQLGLRGQNSNAFPGEAPPAKASGISVDLRNDCRLGVTNAYPGSMSFPVGDSPPTTATGVIPKCRLSIQRRVHCQGKSLWLQYRLETPDPLHRGHGNPILIKKGNHPGAVASVRKSLRLGRTLRAQAAVPWVSFLRWDITPATIGRCLGAPRSDHRERVLRR